MSHDSEVTYYVYQHYPDFSNDQPVIWEVVRGFKGWRLRWRLIRSVWRLLKRSANESMDIRISQTHPQRWRPS